ncbi:hypothetical protein [uncultured Microbulbifer sp.]|uniref:hypothetical protein n=1 Tax=uncultured Microbulbifer sp. TaxID=348147 RepID=UPI0026096F43|nr:hypothetical protein [uncultured Microbulbifer sp.]
MEERFAKLIQLLRVVGGDKVKKLQNTGVRGWWSTTLKKFQTPNGEFMLKSA